MKVVRLSDKFYKEYAGCQEILKKRQCPYMCLAAEVDGLLFAIPFRHHIRHPFAFHTIGEAGIDYKKAVVISDPQYIANDFPVVDSAEWKILKRNEQKIFSEFRSYFRQYKRAMKNREKERSAKYLSYSALQYFEDLF